MDLICQSAKVEPNALAGALRKLKFIKCNLSADFPVLRAVVFQARSALGPDETSEIDIENVQGTALAIAVLNNNGQILVGSIGSTLALVSGPLALVRDSSHELPSLEDKKCLDIAEVTFDDVTTASATSITAIALYSSSTVAVVDLTKKIILQIFCMNCPPFGRISAVAAIPSGSHNGSSVDNQSKWKAVIISVWPLSCSGGAGGGGVNAEMFVLLSDASSKNDSLLLQLGTDTTNFSTRGNTEGEFCQTMSPPGDCQFSSHNDGQLHHLQGRRVSDNLISSVADIIRGLEVGINHTVDRKFDVELIGSNAYILLGQILSLSISQMLGAGDCVGGEKNEFENENDDAVQRYQRLSVQDAVWTAELSNYALIMMSNLNSCGQVAAILNALFLCDRDFPPDYLERTLVAADVSTPWN